jgi:hypothetical protein
MGLKLPKTLTVIIFIILVFFAGFIFLQMTSEIFNPPHPTMAITKFNESGVPDGEIIHLSDQDFTEFPYFAPVIRDNIQNEGVSFRNGTRIQYYVGLSYEERDKMWASKFLAPPKAFFNYKGIYYSFALPTPYPNLTITKINDDAVPDGKIFQISDSDFNEFPYLAPIIRDNSENGASDKLVTRIEFYLELSFEERNKIQASKFFPRIDRFVEYNGTYYIIGAPTLP